MLVKIGLVVGGLVVAAISASVGMIVAFDATSLIYYQDYPFPQIKPPKELLLGGCLGTLLGCSLSGLGIFLLLR